MNNLLGFLQLAAGLAALYVSIYLPLKKKYENLKEEYLKEEYLNERLSLYNSNAHRLENNKKIRKKGQNNLFKRNQTIKSVNLLNTIYIIITLTLILLYFSPFKGFFLFFKGNEFNTLQGKNVYILSSVILFLMLTLSIVIEVIFLCGKDILHKSHVYLFLAFDYIFDIILLLKTNQVALTFYLRAYEKSIIILILCYFFVDVVFLHVFMFSLMGYNMLIDFLIDKFTE